MRASFTPYEIGVPLLSPWSMVQGTRRDELMRIPCRLFDLGCRERDSEGDFIDTKFWEAYTTRAIVGTNSCHCRHLGKFPLPRYRGFICKGKDQLPGDEPQEDVGRFTLKEAVPWQAGHSIMIKMRKISRSE